MHEIFQWRQFNNAHSIIGLKKGTIISIYFTRQDRDQILSTLLTSLE